MTKDNNKNDDKSHNKDEVTGVETTGHEWDGLKELNNPTPRWWLSIFFVCILFSVGYWIVYPAWPTPSGHTKGMLGWTSHKQLAESQAEITARRGNSLEKIAKLSITEINKNPALFEFALHAGKAAFKNNCAACHGTGAQGSKGYPNLNDDDWLWGGKLEDIYTTVKYGIRSNDEETRNSAMPSFGKDEILSKKEIANVAAYVLSLSTKNKPNKKGAEIFADNCTGCHGEKAKGSKMFGAPNLTDAIWLYGSDKNIIKTTIFNGRKGVMPAWVNKLDDATIKSLAIYVHSLGGGK